jgi:D-alanyl-D-alanine carboxypeptidase
VLHAYTSDRNRYEDSIYWNPSWTSFFGTDQLRCLRSCCLEAFGTGKLLTPESTAKISTTTNVRLGGNTPALYFGLGTIVNNGWLLESGNFFGWHTATAYYPPTQTALVVTLRPATRTTVDDPVPRYSRYILRGDRA